MIKTKINHRGFAVAEFTDSYGESCSIQESSNANGAFLWLGCDRGTHVRDEKGQIICCARMHLSIEQVTELIPLLQGFVETGYLNAPPLATSTPTATVSETAAGEEATGQ